MDPATLTAIAAAIAVVLGAWNKIESARAKSASLANKHSADVAAAEGRGARDAVAGWVALIEQLRAEITRLTKAVEHCEQSHQKAREEIQFLRDAGIRRPFVPPQSDPGGAHG